MKAQNVPDTRGLDPAIPLGDAQCVPKRDPRDKSAFTRVFRRAMPAGDVGGEVSAATIRSKHAF